MRRIGRQGEVMVLACAALFWGVAGCARESGTALDRSAFYAPAPAHDVRAQRHEIDDRPPSPMYDHVRMDLMEPQARVRVPVLDRLGQSDAPPPQRVTGISESVNELVQLPLSGGDAGASAAPDAAATSAPPAGSPAVAPGASSGVAMTVGAVVCEVNGAPIFADKVLNSLSRVFAAEARRRGPRAFREYAEKEIREQVGLFIRGELEYAAAKRNLDASEQELASRLTADWRARQISAAGGSIEKARARAQAQGYQFEERVQEQHRLHMVQVYYQKRLLPRAQVRADDMRRYYDRNVRSQFTERAEAQFRVIKIDAQKTGGVDAARQKAEHLRMRAARGEDFAELAGSINDDPNLMRLAGDVGWVQQGAFAVEPVEQAVWQIHPGQVTDIVQVGDAFYIAKLENRKAGRVRPFEEEAVQRQIQKALEGEMIMALRKIENDTLLKDAVVYPDPPDVRVVIDMAMQKYPMWAGSAAAQ